MEFKQSPNFYKGRAGNHITHIIIHAMQGSFQGTIATFMKGYGKGRTSAHYLVSKSGQTLQMVKDEDRAWHVGDANGFTIGIEHEDAFFTKLPGGKYLLSRTCKDDPNWATDKMLHASAKLVAGLVIKFNIPKDKIRERVIGHNDPLMRKFKNNHSDPEKYWPWEKYYKLIEGELANEQSESKKLETNDS